MSTRISNTEKRVNIIPVWKLYLLPARLGQDRWRQNESTRLGYKPKHAVDLDTGVIVAAPIHSADQGDINTLKPTLKAAVENLTAIGLAPTSEDRCDLVTDKGYHSRSVLKQLDDDIWRSRISEPKPANGVLRWHGDEIAQKEVYANRPRLKSTVGRKTMRKRGEMVERSFARVLDRGGVRRAWLRGRENLHKRSLIHVAGFDPSILMSALFRFSTPREADNAAQVVLLVVQTDSMLLFAFVAQAGTKLARCSSASHPTAAKRPFDRNATSSSGC